MYFDISLLKLSLSYIVSTYRHSIDRILLYVRQGYRSLARVRRNTIGSFSL